MNKHKGSEQNHFGYLMDSSNCDNKRKYRESEQNHLGYFSGGANYNRKIETNKYKMIISVGIVAFILIIGVFISNVKYNKALDSKEMYTKAIRIENNTNLFQYGIDTNVGNAFVYGELKALDTVTYPDVDGEYMYLKKVEEQYTMYTVTNTDSKGNTTTETYYSWDTVNSESRVSKNVTFCGIEFYTDKIEIPQWQYIKTVEVSNDTRYVYYGYPVVSKGTMFANLNKENQLGDKKASFYSGLTIDETYKKVMKDYSTPLFWLTLSLVTIGVVWAFFHFDNNWLNKK